MAGDLRASPNGGWASQLFSGVDSDSNHGFNLKQADVHLRMGSGVPSVELLRSVKERHPFARPSLLANGWDRHGGSGKYTHCVDEASLEAGIYESERLSEPFPVWWCGWLPVG